MYMLQNMSAHVPDRVDVVVPYDTKVRNRISTAVRHGIPQVVCFRVCHTCPAAIPHSGFCRVAALLQPDSGQARRYTTWLSSCERPRQDGGLLLRTALILYDWLCRCVQNLRRSMASTSWASCCSSSRAQCVCRCRRLGIPPLGCAACQPPLLAVLAVLAGPHHHSITGW